MQKSGEKEFQKEKTAWAKGRKFTQIYRTEQQRKPMEAAFPVFIILGHSTCLSLTLTIVQINTAGMSSMYSFLFLDIRRFFFEVWRQNFLRHPDQQWLLRGSRNLWQKGSWSFSPKVTMEPSSSPHPPPVLPSTLYVETRRLWKLWNPLRQHIKW